MTNVELTVDRLQKSVAAMQRRCSSRRLQMNPDKTDFIWLGSRTNLQIQAPLPVTSSLTVPSYVVQSVNAVRDLGFTLDSQQLLSMLSNVNKVAQLASITPDD